MDIRAQIRRMFSTPEFDENTASSAISIYRTATGDNISVNIPRELAWYVHDAMQRKEKIDVTFKPRGKGKYEISLESALGKFTFKRQHSDSLEEIRYDLAGLKACEIAEIFQMRLGLEATVLGKDPLQAEEECREALRQGLARYT